MLFKIAITGPESTGKSWLSDKLARCYQTVYVPEIARTYIDQLDIDTPWQHDPQREHPHLRKHFFDWYKQELESYGFDHKVISGLGDTRVNNAIDATESFTFRKTT